MKVWVVEEIYYDQSSLHGVFSTKQKALDYIKTAKYSHITEKQPSFLDPWEFDVDEKSR